MTQRGMTAFSFFLLPILLMLGSPSAHATIVNVDFGPTDIGRGITGQATATVESGTAGGNGYLDIYLTNTSPLGPEVDPGMYANPFITQLDIAIENGWVLNEGASHAKAVSGTYVSDDGNPVLTLASGTILHYKFFESNVPGMSKCLIGAEADNIKNDNAIGSFNILTNGSLGGTP